MLLLIAYDMLTLLTDASETNKKKKKKSIDMHFVHCGTLLL